VFLTGKVFTAFFTLHDNEAPSQKIFIAAKSRSHISKAQGVRLKAQGNFQHAKCSY
jgi:hypothetical protein